MNILARLKALEAGKPVLPEPIVCSTSELAGRVADWNTRNPRASIKPLVIALPDVVEP